MAKTESTAVNELISIMQTQKPLHSDPSEDLLFKIPSQPAPMPRGRAPSGTAEHPAHVPAPQPRMIPATPTMQAVGVSRSGIPLPRVSAPISIPASNPNITLPPLPTSLLRVEAERAKGTPAPELIARTPTTTAPVTMPVAAPFEGPRRLEAPDDRVPARPSPAPGAKLVASLPLPSPRPSVGLPSPRSTAAIAAATPARTLPPATSAARVSAPSAAPVVAAVTPIRAAPATPKAPVVAAVTKSAPVAKAPALDMTGNHGWFDHSPLADELEPGGNTEHVPVHASPVALLGKLAVPMVGLVILGILVGGYVAFSGEGGKPQHHAPAKQVAAAAPAAVAAPAPVAVAALPAAVAAPAPVATPAPAPVAVATTPAAPVEETPAPAAVPAHRVELVDVRIDSHPSGATVMLVDRGKTSFLGTTPLAASVDAARRYDLVFTYGNQPTRIEHLDPRATHKVDVVLGGKQPAAPAIAAAAAPHVEQHAPPAQPAMAAAPTPVHAEPRAPVHADAPEPAPAPHVAHHDAPAPAPAEHDAPPAVPAAPEGKGTLMISSKPPCQITVDGKDTGLTTPQRSMALSPGVHKVTLTSATDPTIKKTVTIQINAGKPTKVIQDLMK